MVPPSDTPGEIIDTLANAEINAMLAEPAMKARIAEIGLTVFASSRAEFGPFIAASTEKWGKVIRAANIKAE